MKNSFCKVLAWMLCLSLCLSLMPTAWAEEFIYEELTDEENWDYAESGCEDPVFEENLDMTYQEAGEEADQEAGREAVRVYFMPTRAMISPAPASVISSRSLALMRKMRPTRSFLSLLVL